VPLSRNAVNLLSQRYCRNGEEPLDVYKRVSVVLSDGDKKLEDDLFYLMSHSYFLPNSPVLFNAGYSNMFHACCTLGIDDNIGSISDFMRNMMIMFKHGAGVGVNYSALRQKDAPLSSGGSSSGIVSLLEYVDKGVDYVKQGGYRRGAAMSILWYWHPEILDFVQKKLKGGLTNMNLSVMVDDQFMEGVINGSPLVYLEPHTGKRIDSKISCSDLLDIISFCAWSCGCPGILFYDRINQDNPYFPEIILQETNPCSESPIPKNSLCTLGSINLSKFVREGKFNYERFEEVIGIAGKTLLNINKLGYYPFSFMEETMKRFNPIGIGVMGFADALIKLGIRYDSEESIGFIRTLGEVYKRKSDFVAPTSFYKRIIAPTGSLSILADCSSGIEPIFSQVFDRHLTVGVIEETRELYKSEYLRVSHEISPDWHLRIQAEWQKWVDGGISKTINMPGYATPKDVKDIYIKAWKAGIKGTTVYRNDSKLDQPLQKKGCSDDTCYL
jgi:ribonucleoside-diphosphate reductase alpha chain